MYDRRHCDHELHGLIDDQLDEESRRTVSAGIDADPKRAARRAAYTSQGEMLRAMRDNLVPAPPAPALQELQDELRELLGHRQQMRVGAAVGGTIALMALVAYASRNERAEPASQN